MAGFLEYFLRVRNASKTISGIVALLVP